MNKVLEKEQNQPCYAKCCLSVAALFFPFCISSSILKDLTNIHKVFQTSVKLICSCLQRFFFFALGKQNNRISLYAEHLCQGYIFSLLQQAQYISILETPDILDNRKFNLGENVYNINRIFFLTALSVTTNGPGLTIQALWNSSLMREGYLDGRIVDMSMVSCTENHFYDYTC